jgi:hypothetical protein
MTNWSDLNFPMLSEGSLMIPGGYLAVSGFSSWGLKKGTGRVEAGAGAGGGRGVTRGAGCWGAVARPGRWRGPAGAARPKQLSYGA